MADKYLMWSDEVETELRAYADRKHACGQTEFANGILKAVNHLQTITKARDAVAVVRCKDCRWARPYERTDGETGYYCHFCGHSFKYGTNWERLFTPIKESDDFCSYGERKDNGNLH